MRTCLVSILLILVTAGYGQSPLATNNSSIRDSLQSPCMQNAHRLLDEALGLMQKNYYRKDYIDWDSLVFQARDRLNNSLNCEDAYGTINWCFQQINEKHSFVMPTAKAIEYAQSKELNESIKKQVGDMKKELIADSIGYIMVPWVNSTDEKICVAVADSLQLMIKELEQAGVNKWIVDLRNNKGGNCWPMIAGIGSLIGEGISGYFVRNGEMVPIRYENGEAFQGKYSRCKSNQPYSLKKEPAKIAVLINNGTSSSGEIVALAFKGRANTIFWGESTAGYTTANATYTLSDKSMLVLTVCKEADRTGKICNGRIYPDQYIPQSADTDLTKKAASLWLLK
jgi:carboxyl-terminal processing protease